MLKKQYGRFKLLWINLVPYTITHTCAVFLLGFGEIEINRVNCFTCD